MKRLALVLALGSAACANDLVGTGAQLRIFSNAAPELNVGAQLELHVAVGARVLRSTEVEWLSRDPTTATVRDGVVRGIAPGLAYVVAVRGDAMDSIRVSVSFSDLAAGQAGVRSGADLLRLTGGAWLTQNTLDASKFYTAIIAGSGGVTETPLGQCCVVLGDTILQVNFVGRPALGVRTMIPPRVEIMNFTTQVLYHTGDDDMLLMVRRDDFHMQFFLPVRPMSLEITAMTDVTPDTPGHLRGRLSFEAAGILQTLDNHGNATYSPIGDRTTRIYAEFDTPLALRYFTPPVPGQGATSPYRGITAATLR